MIEHQVAYYLRVLHFGPDARRREAVRGLATLWPRLDPTGALVAAHRAAALAGLVSAMDDDGPPWRLRQPAVRGLRRLGAPVEVLRPLTRHRDRTVRRGSLVVLAQLHPDTARDMLVNGETEDLGNWPASAVRGLGGVTREPAELVSRLAAELPVQWRGNAAADALAGLGRRFGVDLVRPVAIPLLTDPRPVLRCVALRMLHRMADPEWVPRHVAALRDLEPMVRCAAVYALVPAPETTAETLAPVRADPDAHVRDALAGMLAARPGLPGALDLLDALLAEETDASLLGAAIRALVAVPGPAALDRLHALLADPRRWAKLGAAGVLGRRSDATERTTALVAELLTDPDRQIRYSAANSVAELEGRRGATRRRFRSPYLPAIAAMLADPDDGDRHRVTRALGRLGDRRAIPLIVATAEAGRMSPTEARQTVRQLGTAAEPRLARLPEWRYSWELRDRYRAEREQEQLTPRAR